MISSNIRRRSSKKEIITVSLNLIISSRSYYCGRLKHEDNKLNHNNNKLKYGDYCSGMKITKLIRSSVKMPSLSMKIWLITSSTNSWLAVISPSRSRRQARSSSAQHGAFKHKTRKRRGQIMRTEDEKMEKDESKKRGK